MPNVQSAILNSSHPETSKKTQSLCASDFVRAKREGRKLSMVTCYDFAFASVLANSAIDGILIGDSAVMVMHGHPSTLSANMELMRLHTEAVARGAGGKFLVADLPFLSFRKGLAAALDSAATLMAAGAHAVKLEGVDGHEDVIQRLAESGVPVMGHLGMQPQSVHAYGGFRVQGRTSLAAKEIMRQAQALEQLGAFAMVLGCVPAAMAQEVTQSLRIPTIGIGAGSSCDGQILVLQDLLGLTESSPRFARRFWNGADEVRNALAQFNDAVKDGTFPSNDESYL